jgi:hypothetical protein
MDYDKLYKSLPEIGTKDYDDKLKELDAQIPFTIEELFDKIPAELEYSDTQTMKFTLSKIGKKWYIARYWVYKSPYHRNWEEVTMTYFPGPTAKIALYGAYCFTNKEKK